MGGGGTVGCYHHPLGVARYHHQVLAGTVWPPSKVREVLKGPRGSEDTTKCRPAPGVTLPVSPYTFSHSLGQTEERLQDRLK